jgi:PDZ domain-containing protein
MTNSQADAVTAALLQLDYKPKTRHLIVGELTQGLPAESVLQVGDELLEVDGTATHGPRAFSELISRHQPGDNVELTIRRGGRDKHVTVGTVRANDSTGRPLIGISLDQRATFGDVHVRIGIDPGDVGGPSAGLAFALGIVDKLTPGSLTGGRTIAGTGTIDGFGNVGPIGGIQQKIAAAANAGASVFLAPVDDCAEAKEVAPSSLTLVKVDTLQTALDALDAIGSGSTAFPTC